MISFCVLRGACDANMYLYGIFVRRSRREIDFINENIAMRIESIYSVCRTLRLCCIRYFNLSEYKHDFQRVHLEADGWKNYYKKMRNKQAKQCKRIHEKNTHQAFHMRSKKKKMKNRWMEFSTYFTSAMIWKLLFFFSFSCDFFTKAHQAALSDHLEFN